MFTAFAGLTAAQDDEGYKWGVNAGIEMNMNSGNHFELHNIAALGFGIHTGGEYNINDMFAAGLNLNFSFSDFFAFEAAGFFRWYFLRGMPKAIGFLRNIFAQADLGLWAGNDIHSEAVKFLGGVSAGIRFKLPGNFYIEPYARFGYPFLFGVGVTAGYRFKETIRFDAKSGDTAPVPIHEHSKSEDAAVAVPTEVETKTEVETVIEAEAEIEIEVEAKIEVEVEVKTEIEAEIEAKAEIEVKIDLEAEAEIEVKTKAEIEVEAKIEAEAETTIADTDITVTATKEPDKGQTVEYAISETNTAPETDTDSLDPISSHKAYEKFSVTQVRDCQRSPAYPANGQSMTLRGFSNPYTDINRTQLPNTVLNTEGAYFQLTEADNYTESHKNLVLELYNADGSRLREVARGGHIHIFFEEGFLYIGASNDIGYVFFYEPLNGRTSITVTSFEMP